MLGRDRQPVITLAALLRMTRWVSESFVIVGLRFGTR